MNKTVNSYRSNLSLCSETLNFNRGNLSLCSETVNFNRGELSSGSETFLRHKFSKLFEFSLVLKKKDEFQVKMSFSMFGVGKYFSHILTPRTFGACPSLLKERGEVRLRTLG